MRSKVRYLLLVTICVMLAAAKCTPPPPPPPSAQPTPITRITPSSSPRLNVGAPTRYVAPPDWTTTPAPTQPNLSSVSSESQSAGCLDPWITKAVLGETNQMPIGPVCNVNLYNNGQWPDYPTLQRAVHAVLTTCTDEWITQAFIQVSGRIPYSSECDYTRYAGGNWGTDYQRLVTGVAVALGRSGDELLSPGVPPADAHHYSLLATSTPDVRQYQQCQYAGFHAVGDTYVPTFENCTTYPVSHHLHVSVLYWGKAWAGSGGPPLMSYLDSGIDFMNDRSHYLDPLVQYGVHKGYGYDAHVDSSSGPAWAIVDPGGLSQVQREIGAMQGNGTLPAHWMVNGANDPIIVVVVPEQEMGGDLLASQWLGYHLLTYDTNTCSGCYGYVPYVVVKAPQRAFWIDQTAIEGVLDSISHEVVEAATNPVPLFGWSDWGQSSVGSVWDTAEPADICGYSNANNENYSAMPYQDDPANPKSYTYELARYWSNWDHDCYPTTASTINYPPGATGTYHLL